MPSQAAQYAMQHQQQWSPQSDQIHLEVGSGGGYHQPQQPPFQRAVSPAISADDDGYVSANTGSWDHSQSMAHASSAHSRSHPYSNNNATRGVPSSAAAYATSPIPNGGVAPGSSELPLTPAEGDWDAPGAQHGFRAPNRQASPGVPSKAPMRPAAPTRPPPRASDRSPRQPSPVAAGFPEEDDRPLGQVRADMAGNSAAVPPVPAIPDAHAGEPRSRPRGAAPRSPVLSYAEGEAEEEKIYEASQQSADLKRMASFGPKVKKNAPAPWEVEGDEEEFLMLPNNDKGAASISSAGSKASQWFGRKSTDGGHHTSPEKARPSMDSYGRMADYHEDPSADTASTTGSFFANTRARSKSVSSSAAGVLKGLGLSSSGSGSSHNAAPGASSSSGAAAGGGSSSAAASAKKKVAKLGKQLKKGSEDSSKSKMNLSAGISSADYQNLPPDWSPPVQSVDLASRQSLAVAPTRGSSVPPSSASATSGPRSPMHPASQYQVQQQQHHPQQDTNGRLRQSSSNESTTNLSTFSPTDASQSTAATSPATPSFVEMRSGVPGKELGSPAMRSLPMEPMASAGSELMNGAHPQQQQEQVMQTRYEGATPYKLISLEQARMNQIREKELARQRDEAYASNHHETPRAGTQADGFPRSASRTSMSSDHQHNHGHGHGHTKDKGADTKSLRGRKSGFLRNMFNKDKGGGVPAEPSPALPSDYGNSGAAAYARANAPSSGSAADEGNTSAGGLPRSATSATLTAPALQLRPMSSMFSNFEPDLLDVSAVASASTQNQPEPSPALSSTSVASSTLSTRRRAPAPADIITTPYAAKASAGPISSKSLSASNAGSGGAPHTRSSTDTNSETSPGVFFSPASSPANVAFRNVSDPPLGSMKRTKSSDSLDSAASIRAVPAETVLPTPGWKKRVMEIEAQMAELAAELTTMRQQQAMVGLVSPTSPELQQQQQLPHGRENSSNTANSSFDPASMSVGSSSLSAALPSSSPMLSSSPGAPPRSPGVMSVNSSHSAATSGNAGIASSQPIPPCAMCGCACAEKRRQQAINEAATLKGVSVLERGRAIKPLGDGNTTKFGGYRDR